MSHAVWVAATLLAALAVAGEAVRPAPPSSAGPSDDTARQFRWEGVRTSPHDPRAVQAHLEGEGRVLADADLQIAVTALHHDLEFVTGNFRPFRRSLGLRICLALAEARTRHQ